MGGRHKIARHNARLVQAVSDARAIESFVFCVQVGGRSTDVTAVLQYEIDAILQAWKILRVVYCVFQACTSLCYEASVQKRHRTKAFKAFSGGSEANEKWEHSPVPPAHVAANGLQENEFQPLLGPEEALPDAPPPLPEALPTPSAQEVPPAPQLVPLLPQQVPPPPPPPPPPLPPDVPPASILRALRAVLFVCAIVSTFGLIIWPCLSWILSWFFPGTENPYAVCSYAVGSVNFMTWALYACWNNLNCWITGINGFGAVVNIVYFFVSICHSEVNIIVIASIGLAGFGLVAASWCLDVLGLLGFVTTILTGVTGAALQYISHCVSFSAGVTIFIAVVSSFWLAYGLLIGDWKMSAANFGAVLGCVGQGILYVTYCNNN